MERKRRNMLKLASEAHSNAEKLATILYRKYRASRVFLFGSLVSRNMFGARSDIDLAVEGIPGMKFFDAAGELLMKSHFNVNLIPLEDCTQKLRENILAIGEKL